MAKILIVEDDATFGRLLYAWLGKRGYKTQLVGTVEAARQTITNERFDLVITDLRLPDSDGILLLQWIKEHNPQTAVIIMTNYADISSAVAAIKLGAQDYLEKPIRPDELNAKIEAILHEKPHIQTKAATAVTTNEYVRGTDEVSVKLYDHMMIVAPTDMSVLITGESGTGKEYVAKFIHQNSCRAERPFIAVDCGAISRELGVSELFGHKRGAFTSAVSDKQGVFEAANGGTVFLDEIGNLSLEIQMQLLRALQERRIRPVGASEEIAIDIRLLSATNENLPRAIEQGRFREDLYHRINEFSLQVPALRDRTGDIMTFAGTFLSQACRELDKTVTGFSMPVEELFCRYAWSGNLRQMRNVVKRAVLFSRGSLIELNDLPEEMMRCDQDELSSAASLPLKRTDERERIVQALERCENNKSRAAKLLQIDRKTLYNKLKLYDIDL